MNSKEFIELCKNNDIQEVQITLNNSYVATLYVINDEITKNQVIDVTNYLVKANILDKTISIKTECLDENLIEDLKNIAVSLEIEEKEIFIENESNIERNNVEKISLDNYKDLLLKNNKIRLKEYPSTYNIVQELVYISNKKEIINSKNTELISSNNYYEYLIEATAKENDNCVVDVNTITAKKIEDLKIEELFIKTLEENKHHLNEQEIKSGKYKVLFEPKTTISLMKFLGSMLNGENILTKVSLLENKLNQKIFSDKLTLIEDPTDITKPSYRTFDDEGTKTTKKEIITNGIINTYLYDNKTAIKANINSTGNSYNNSISYHNLYIKPGSKTKEELIKEMNNGILITDLLVSGGSSSITTGAYTGQAYGFLIEDGKIKCAIKNALFDTNLIDLLNNIIEVGSEIEYCNSIIGSPALLVDNISFIGKGE